MIEYTVKVDDDGTKRWYLNGKKHREDGPAIEYVDGTKFWFLNGKLHRENGPAVEYSGGTKEWHLNGKELTEGEHRKATRKNKEYMTPDWINIENSLPKGNNICVIVRSTKDEVYPCIFYDGSMSSNGPFFRKEGYIDDEVGITHWMPLPKPPKVKN